VSATALRRRVGPIGALLGLLALAGALVLVARDGGEQPGGASPRAANSTRPFPGARPLPSACARTASGPRQLEREFAAATSGQVICLAAGDYGTFRGGSKPGRVGVRAERGAEVRMALDFESAVNVHVEGVTVTNALIRGASRDVTVARSRFTGLAVIQAQQMANARILFDRNVHADIDTCTSCFQGRVHVDGRSEQPSGVVIANSVFSGGNSDGVRADANGVQILGNEFYGLRDEDPFHTDPIQLYGGTRVVIRGNYFHDNAVSAQIMMADGGDHNVVEDNVIAGDGYTWAVTWYSDDGSTIAHNTFADGTCNAGVRCGVVNVGAKAGMPPGRGTIIRDNVMGGISNGGGDQDSTFVAERNLTALPTPGAGNVTAEPAFRGPLDTYAGYALAPGSPGAGQASDGTDPGIRVER
jgi:hypothetical protein